MKPAASEPLVYLAATNREIKISKLHIKTKTAQQFQRQTVGAKKKTKIKLKFVTVPNR